MQRREAMFAATLAVLTLAGAASADVTTVNGFRNNFRNFNDYPTSTLAASSNFGAGTVDIVESNFGPHGGGTFANRHRVFFSSTLGVTDYPVANQDYFDLLTAAPGNTGLIVGQPGDQRTVGVTLRVALRK